MCAHFTFTKMILSPSKINNIANTKMIFSPQKPYFNKAFFVLHSSMGQNKTQSLRKTYEAVYWSQMSPCLCDKCNRNHVVYYTRISVIL